MRSFTARKLSQMLSLILLAFSLTLLPGPTATLALAQEGPPLMFIENVGQFSSESIRFQAQAGQITLWLSESALWFTLLEEPTAEIQVQNAPSADPATQPPTPNPQRGVNLKLSFLKANPQPAVEPFNRLETHVSYFTGNDPANWRSDVPVWGGVRYVDLYPGIDLEITGDNGQMSQRWVVKEDVRVAETLSLSDIRWQVEGADAVSLEAGQLRLATALGDFTLPLPQTVDLNGAPLDLSTTPEINGLEIASPFSPESSPLSSSAHIADAADLLYSTFLGGPGPLDSAREIAADAAGHAYITGLAYPGFPSTPGVFDPTVDGVYTDVFIAKLNPAGSGLIYTTFLGGSDFDIGQAISVDGAGNAFVAGYTTSTNFPTTPGAFDSTLTDESDAFVAKLNPIGTGLLFSTLLGGSNLDFGLALAVDQAGHAYVSGFTQSFDFSTTGDVATAGYFGGFTDAFAAKLAPDGGSLIYSVLLGGTGSDYSHGLAIDPAGNAYVAGYTFSMDFPTTPGAWDTTPSSSEAILVKLNPAGETIYSTFLGGSGGESGYGVAVDSSGNAYITGFTESIDFPATPGAFDTTFNSSYSGDAFVAKVLPNGSGLAYATYIGGNHHDYGEDIVVDSEGSVYLTGVTSSADFPTTVGAFDTVCAGCSQTYPNPDAYVTKLHPNGTLAYSTFLGGDTHYDHGWGLALGEINQVYLTGDTSSTDFPTTPGAYDPTLNGNGDAFAAKLAIRPGAITPPSPVPTHSCAPTLLGTVMVGNQPRGLAIDSAHRRVYVANFGSNSISVVDSQTNTVIQTIPNITSANGLAYDPTHNRIWVSNYQANQVTPIQANDDATSFTPLSPLAVGLGPWGVTYDPVHDFIYVLNSEADSITVIDAAAQTIVTTLSGSFNDPFHAAANPLTGKVYVANYGNNSVTVLQGTTVSRVIQLWDSGRPYGLAVDEVRNLVYVATTQAHRIVVIGPIRGVPDQFYGWAAFHRGFGDPRRPVPLRMIAVQPGLGPSGDGGHIWATTFTADGSESNQALFIPKGWGGGFHFPLAQNIGDYPIEGLAIDRATNRVYVNSGTIFGMLTVLGDHAALCQDAFTKIASLEDRADQPAGGDSASHPGGDTDQIGVEIQDNSQEGGPPANNDVNQDGVVDLLDLAFVAARYGSNDPAADLNADGQVDIFDLVIVANNYGQ